MLFDQRKINIQGRTQWCTLSAGINLIGGVDLIALTPALTLPSAS